MNALNRKIAFLLALFMFVLSCPFSSFYNYAEALPNGEEDKSDDVKIVAYVEDYLKTENDEAFGDSFDENLDGMASGDVVCIYQGEAIPYGEAYSTHYYSTSSNPNNVNCNVYCVDPGRLGPNGLMYEASVVDNAILRKVMYYSYGAPGWGYDAKTHFNNGFFVGKDVDAKKYYSYSHFLLSYACYINGTCGGEGYNQGALGFIQGVEAVYQAILTLPEPPAHFKVYSLTSDNAYQRMLTWDFDLLGSVAVEKTCQAGISAQGAIFHVYYYPNEERRSKDLANHYQSADIADCGSFSIDANGKGYVCGNPTVFVLDNLKLGCYLLVETTKPWDERTYNTYGWKVDGEDWKGPIAFEITETNCSETLVFSTKDEVVKSRISLTKYSSETDITNNNKLYDLSNAEYAIYLSKDDANNKTNSVGIIKTDKSGEGSIGGLDYGTYFLKEIVAPKNYELDENVYQVTTGTDDLKAHLNVYDKPEYDRLRIILKKVSEEGQAIPNAKYVVKYYDNVIGDVSTAPVRTWHFVTDEEGEIHYGNGWLDKEQENDTLFTIKIDGNYLPFGTISVQEYEAPEGYKIDEQVRIYTCDGTKNETLDERKNSRIVVEETARQSFAIKKLGEQKNHDAKPLKNAGFSACNIKDLEKDSNGNYVWNSEKEIPLTEKGELILYTDEAGYALSKELEYGTYLVRETVVPEGFLAVDDFLVVIDKDSREPQEIRYFIDDEIKAYLKIIKKDDKSLRPILRKEAAFKIWSYNEEAYVDFNGEEIVYTNDEGELITPDYLTYGKYRIDEIASPDQYAETILASVEFEIKSTDAFDTYYDENGNAVVNMGLYTVTVYDSRQYGCIEIYKKGEEREYNPETDEFYVKEVELEGISFDVFAKEDIFEPDGSGVVIYHKEDKICTLVTDAFGYAKTDLLPLGKYVVQEQTPDEYEITEPFLADLNENGIIILQEQDEETIEVKTITYNILNYMKNQRIVGTTAKDNETQIPCSNPKAAVIVDCVSYKDLVVGKEYELEATIMVKEDGTPLIDKEGNSISVKATFIPEISDGCFEMNIPIDTSKFVSGLAGKTIVVYEYLYCDGKLMSKHTDLDSETQFIKFPTISTTAKDIETDSHDGKRSEKSTIVDTVTYENLYIHENVNYIIRGKLMDVETGKEFLINDEPVTAEYMFNSKEEFEAGKFGTANLFYEINSISLKGKSVVVFENIYAIKEDGTEILVASHENISDKGQTVTYDNEVGCLVLAAKEDKKVGHETIITGDNSKILLFLILGLCSAVLLAYILIKRRGHHE